MSYVQVLNEGQRVGRKAHQCFDCGRDIPRGVAHFFQTCKYDDVYTIRQHNDCRAAADFYRSYRGLSGWDFEEGIPPLAEMLSDHSEVDLDISTLRGRFPHVACRLELTRQLRKNA